MGELVERPPILEGTTGELPPQIAQWARTRTKPARAGSKGQLRLRAGYGGINTKLGSKCQCGLKKIDLRPQAVAQVLGRGAALPDSFPY